MEPCKQARISVTTEKISLKEKSADDLKKAIDPETSLPGS